MSKHLARMGRKISLLKEGNHQQNQPLGVTGICHDWLGMRGWRDEELDELLKKETKTKTVYQPPDGLELILQKMGLKTGGCHILSF